MFGSQILEVAIGLVFVYLLLSLICTSANELISSWSKKRGQLLRKGIENLLSDPTKPKLAQEFYEHPLIKALYQEGRDPSHIPPRTFALALLDIISPAGSNGPKGVEGFRDAVTTAFEKDSWLRRAVLPLMDEAGEEIAKFRENIERWYDDAMARVTGWYKRTMQLWTVGLAVIITIGLNVDTIEIANNLWRSPTLRASLIAAAQKMIKEAPPVVSGGGPSTQETVKQPTVPVAPQKEGQTPAKSSAIQSPPAPVLQPETQRSPQDTSTTSPTPTPQSGTQTAPQGTGIQTSSSGAKPEAAQIGAIVKQIEQLDQLPIG
jgi:hypothetical protein